MVQLQTGLTCTVLFGVLAFGSTGVARGTAFTAVKTVRPAIAVQGLQFRALEAASERRYWRSKFEQARA